MSKRRQEDLDGKAISPAAEEDSFVPMQQQQHDKKIKHKPEKVDLSSDEESDDERDLVNVDFEFFDPQEHDFLGIKRLLQQLFHVDSTLLDLSALTDLILEQKLVGSTVKVDGREGDPFAFLSIINFRMHGDRECVQTLLKYLKGKLKGSPLDPVVASLLEPNAATNLAVVLSERMINMPFEIAPPMYNMLLEEIDLAIADKEPYEFSHFLIVSKVYVEIESKIESEETRPAKRQKAKKSGAKSSPVMSFHQEDDTLIAAAEKADTSTTVYNYTNEQSEQSADSKRAFQDFGILPRGRMILLNKDSFVKAVEKLQTITSG